MTDQPTTRELYKAKAITDEEVRAAVDAYMADPATSLFAITERYSLDLAGKLSARTPGRNKQCPMPMQPNT